uniref:A disintegrin and metalloproteinase with thrombospondin motifs 1 n=1 Tax=Astyanax mexicanus TaxID=7994 RepID=A0A8B9HG51_ASTMX
PGFYWTSLLLGVFFRGILVGGENIAELDLKNSPSGRSERRLKYKYQRVYRIRAVDLPESGASEGRQEAKRLRRQVADGVFTSSHPHKTVKTTWESGTELRGCFFTGTVDSSPDSLVAVSLCHGMLGSFIWQGEEFQIEPKRFGSGSSTDQLHLLRRRNFTRTLLGLKSSFGPVDDDGHYSTPCPVTEGKEGTMKESTEDSLETLRDDTDTEVTDSDGQHGTVIDRKLNEGTSSRHRRFVSVPRFVETLVVADASMYRFYGDEIKHYILTLVSVATQLYKHPSIKNSVNIVVVKVLIVEDEEVGPSLSSNGGLALRSFCSWQHLFNPSSQRHPEHFDTAVLFTREDICGHQSCDTLGVADVGTMCDPKRSCSVIEDSGLQAAFTVAHELGHVLSMPHDDSRNCERHFGQMAQNHIMAPVFNGFNRTYPWSPCSAFYITEFFDNGHGDCLLDAPEKTLPLPTDLPGLSYSLELQCQQVFGEGFLFCHNSSATEVCRQLWCQQEGQSVCTTRNGSLPWADGTHCAHGKTCLDGVCTATEEVMKPKVNYVSVDGGWGEWGAWQQCSRSCGGGVMFSYRECDQPTPQNGGSYCRGQRVQYQSCNTQTCESSHGNRGYSDIVTIPIGATNIDIKQRSHGGVKHDGSYLAVKQASGEYLLNGNFSVSTVEQDIPARGAVLKYSGSATTLERIQSFRQLQEVLVIQLLSTAAEPNPPKVKYTFFIPKGVTFNKPKEKSPSAHVIHPFGVPQWVLGEWSECSKSCGSGWSRRTVECKDNAGFYSNHCDKDLKPTDIRPCADLPCPMWQIGPWSSCSRTCGRGERRRSVLCIDYTGKAVEKEKCDPSKQPKAVSEECMYQDCLELPDKQDMDK